MEYVLREALLPISPHYSVTEKVFASRGLAPNKILQYLNPAKENLLDPLLLDNMEEGAELLLKHYRNKDDIFVLVDCDADGYTSAAALINYLNHLDSEYAQNHIKYQIHKGKQHGLSDQVEHLLQEKYKLVICPDSSSNDYEVHKTLKDNGTDILVLDHHEAQKYSEDACVINNQLSKQYSNKTLSGVGVVYKFCEYLDKILEVDYSKEILDLTAVGIIGDMMSLLNLETKYLITEGLDSLNIKNPFIRTIVNLQDFSISRAGGLCPFSVSFYIVPLINGTIRSGTFEEKMLLFESMLDFKGDEMIASTKRGHKGETEPLAVQACRNAVNIKRHQDKEVVESVDKIEKIIQDKELVNNKIIAVQLNPEQVTNRNLTGLIATKLVSKYQHPVLLLTEVKHKDGSITWEGSGRGYNTSNFNNFKGFVENSHLVQYAEGHASAFGCSIPDSNFDNFIDYSNKELADCSFVPCSKVDFVWRQNDFTARDIIEIGNLKTIWGQDLEEPKLVIEKIPITPDKIQVMSKDKNPTLKISLPNGVDMIKFKVTEEEIEKLTATSPYGCVYINVLGTAATNEWNGNVNAQIKIAEYEIVSNTEYYF